MSDFGIEIPVDDIDESTFVMAAQVQSSPDRLPPDLDGPDTGEFAPLAEQRSDDYDDEDLGPVPVLEEEPLEATNESPRGETEVEAAATGRAEGHESKKRGIKVSKHGIEYPSLPPAVVKRLAQTFAKTSGAKGKITPDAMKTIMQASDWFFEQVGEDLQAYAKHAGRKTIDESDVLTLMKRYCTVYRWVSRTMMYMTDTFKAASDQLTYYTIRSRPTAPS
jgi:histone H3/H4